MRRLLLRTIVLLALAAPAAESARAQDAAAAGDLALILSMEDRRVFDGPQLVRLAQHPEALVRLHAARAMGRIGDRAALPTLLQLFTDRDSAVRTETVFALGTLGDRGAVTELAAAASRFPPIASGDFVTEVVTALAKLGGVDADHALESILDRHPASGERADRATAAVLIEAWRLGRRSAVARKLADYVRTARGDWRQNAAYSAARLRLTDAASALLEASADSNPGTRAYATRGLLAPLADSAGLGRDAFVSRLRVLVNDEDAQTRINALQSLASFADSNLVPIVAARLVDRDPNVPIRAAQTLGSLGGSQASATLAERFPGGTSFGFRRAVLLALAQVNGTQAIETGRAWRSDSEWRARAAYAEMLGAGKTAAARQQLAEMLADPEPRVVGFVLNALGTVVPRGDTTLLTMARAQLNANDVIVRATAVDILGRERNPAFIRELTSAYRRAEADPLDDARLAAVRALAAIADSVPESRSEVEASFLAAFPRSPDYGVRRLAAARFGDAAMRRTWGPARPIETGRTMEEYRDLAARFILGQARPGNITIETDRGDIIIQLFPAEAPLTVENFLRLTDRRFFDNGRWHRVVPNFVAQDGDPRGDGSGGPGTSIRDEFNRHRYGQGTVGMALSGPDTGGSQFFITFSPQPHLDGGYTIFGQVVGGGNILEQIVQGDRIRRIHR